MGAIGFVGGKKTLLISSSSSAASLARGSSGARNRLSRRPCSPVQYHDNNYCHSVTKGRHGGRDSCCRNGRTRRLRCEASSSSNLSTRDRVLKGTALVRAGKLKEAVRELEPLIEGPLTKEEAAAAYYNLACAYSRLSEFSKVSDPLLRAVNDYGVKYSVVLEDDDLEPFRFSRYFDEIQTEFKGGVKSDEQYAKLRAEAKSPFRTFRLFAFGALGAGAGVGLLIILTRLTLAIKGGEGAPDLGESVRNFGINSTAVAVLTFLFLRELKQGKEQLKIVEEEEDMGKLLVDLGANRVAPLSRLRQQYRPVILFGDESYLKKCIKAANMNKRDLQTKGVLLIPLLEETVAWRRGQTMAESRGFTSSSSLDTIEREQRWIVQPRESEEWVAWINARKEAAQGLQYSESMYVQIQLDGTVGAMGAGAPAWKELLKLPDRESFQSKVTG